MRLFDEAVPTGFEAINLGEGFGEHFGIIYSKLAGDKKILGFRILDYHLNHAGVCHGGAIALFADMQLENVKHLLKDIKSHHPTKNLNIDYIAPIHPNAWLEMEAELVRETRKTIYTHATMKVDDRVAVRTSACYHKP